MVAYISLREYQVLGKIEESDQFMDYKVDEIWVMQSQERIQTNARREYKSENLQSQRGRECCQEIIEFSLTVEVSLS